MQQTPIVPRTIIRRDRLRELVPYNDSTIARWEAAEKFPRRVQVGPGSVGWYLDEIIAWQQSLKPATGGRSPNPLAKKAAEART